VIDLLTGRGITERREPMPEERVARILRLPGSGVYACEAEEETGTLTLWMRQRAEEPSYVCGGCGISIRDVHS
jgi:hypothetical protein